MNSSTQISIVQVEVPRELMGEAGAQPPLYVKSTQKKQITQTLNIYKSPELAKPSIMAGLPIELNNKNFTVSIIDNKFIEAIEDYKKSFINATAKDLSKSLSMRNASKDFCAAMCQGAERLAQRTPNIAVVKHIIGPLLMFWGAVWGGVRSNSFIAEMKKKENSANRDKWFKEVIIKEEVRIKESIKLIQKRADKIFRDMSQMKDVIDDDLISELRILATFMNYFSPETPLQVNRMPVLTYLQQYEVEVEVEDKGKGKEKLID